MTAHRGFDEQLEALEALRTREVDADLAAALKKALTNRNNVVVAKAAQIAEEKKLLELIPDLQQAFERFFINPTKSDPQCWAKNALIRALANLECTEEYVFLRGLHFHQMEPTWGSQSDSAGTLRAACARALLGCDALSDQDVLLLLTDLLADPEKQVRIETVRAMSRIGPIALPVLRLRALLPGEDAKGLAVCFQALLELDIESSLQFVAQFLEAGDATSAEAAFALAETRTAEALEILLAKRRSLDNADPWFAGALVNAIAMTRLPAAADHLLSWIESEDLDGAAAIEALCKLFPDTEVQRRLSEVVESTGSPRLGRVLKEHVGTH